MESKLVTLQSGIRKSKGSFLALTPFMPVVVPTQQHQFRCLVTSCNGKKLGHKANHSLFLVQSSLPRMTPLQYYFLFLPDFSTLHTKMALRRIENYRQMSSNKERKKNWNDYDDDVEASLFYCILIFGKTRNMFDVRTKLKVG